MSTKHQHSDEFEELYLKERKKSSILVAVVVVLALATTGSLLWGINKNSSTAQLPTGAQSQGFGQGGPPSGGMRMNIKSFFKDDGSVDSDKVDELTSRAPSGAGSRFTDMFKEQADKAVEDGDITQAQADDLIAKIKAASESSDGN
ncbi:MAG: hypothetical protein Q7T74_00640 [Candidatus Saccharibacteria bacterium]|nr:hypothetical protein [Candidatus Saccharibacteria bacterium]